MRRNMSGMSRRRFIGTSAAGMAAAGMMGSGVSMAGSPPTYRKAQVGILNRNYTTNYLAEEEQIRAVLDTLGITYYVENLNASEDPLVVYNTTKKILSRDVKGLLLLTSSSQGLYAMNAVEENGSCYPKDVQVISLNATSIGNSNPLGGYFARLNASGFSWGYNAADEALAQLGGVGAFNGFAFIRRAATATSDDLFGYWTEQGFNARLAEEGITSTTIIMDTPGNTFTPDLSLLNSGTCRDLHRRSQTNGNEDHARSGNPSSRGLHLRPSGSG